MRVAVIGGGVMGAATAWRLTLRGVDAVCFDRYSPPHTLGSSHSESRIIRTAYFEGSWYVPLLQEAFGMWRELEAASRSRILTMTGALYIGAETSGVVTGAQLAAREHDLDIETLDASDLRRRYPGHVVGDGDVAVLDVQAGILNPEAAVTAMLSQAADVQRGVEIHSIEEVRSQFDAVVVAAGPWTPELVDWIPLEVERQAHAWFAIEPGVDWFTPDRFPVYIRESGTLGDVYGFPTLDGVSVKAARHHQGEVTNPHEIRRVVDEADLAHIRPVPATYMRGVSDRIVRTATCMYTNTPDNHFVIDFAPGDDHVVVISACSGHGFKFGPIVGDIAADLVCDGQTKRDISRFSAGRFATPAHVPDDDHDRDQ